MIADEQTQTLPSDPHKLAGLARFSGFAGTPEFSSRLTAELERVQDHYVRLFEQSPELTTGGANMVFAGEADDPGTLQALSAMGYKRPEAIIAGVRGSTGPIVARATSVRVEHDRARAIKSTLDGAAAGDAVVVAGKGHENYQVYGTERRPFSDQAVIRAHLGEQA